MARVWEAELAEDRRLMSEETQGLLSLALSDDPCEYMQRIGDKTVIILELDQLQWIIDQARKPK